MLQTGRVSGVLLPLFSLRSRSDFGIGDFGGADGLLSWMEAARQKLWMVLPLLPTAPGDPSPYATRSAFGLNPLFIDLDQVQEFAEAGGVKSLSDAERHQLEEARSSPQIRYDLVFPLKNAALRRAFDTFLERHEKSHDARDQEFRRYQDEQKSWLADFALFTAISNEQQQRAWWEWPEGLRDRSERALAEARKRLARDVEFQEWLQYVAETQWRKVREQAKRRGVLLCGDEPFIIGQNSADCWSHPELLRRDARLGVPPDDFSATGQDWGLPFFDFAAMEREGYRWLMERARKSAAYYDLRRVDHAVGYFRQWIRDQKTPTGRFIPEGGDRVHQAVGEKNFRMLGQEGGVIAEDLGVIPPFVRETLSRLGMPGYKVMRWERDNGVYRDPHQYPRVSLATTGTHDTDTVREWWEKAQPSEREGMVRVYREMKGMNPSAQFTPEIHRGLLAAAESSASDLVVLPWQDILGTLDRVNLPGSQTESNWAYRIAQPVDALLTDPQTRQAAKMIAELTQAAQR